MLYQFNTRGIEIQTKWLNIQSLFSLVKDWGIDISLNKCMYDGRLHDHITLLAGRRKGLEATMKKTPFLHQLRGHLGFLEVFEMVKSYQEIPIKTRQTTTTVAPSVMRKCRRRTVTKNELHLFRNSMRKCWLPYIGKWNNSSGKTKVL